MLFKIDNLKEVTQLHTERTREEKYIQRLFEKNLPDVLDLDVRFLKSEYRTDNGRIDTLGIDKKNSPVIIEYKKEQNSCIIPQALYYLDWLLGHKGDFESLCRDKGIDEKRIKNLDWSSPRIICVAEGYNKFDLNAVKRINHNIELMKFEIYEENILLVEHVNQEKFKKTTAQDKEDKELKESQKEYSLEGYLEEKGSDKTKELFYTLKERILNLDSEIVETVKKHYISYRLAKIFASVVVKKDDIKIFLKPKKDELKNAEKVEDFSKKGHLGVGYSGVTINPEENLDEYFNLIEQAYYYNK